MLSIGFRFEARAAAALDAELASFFLGIAQAARAEEGTAPPGEVVRAASGGDTVRDVGLRDKLTKKPKHDLDEIRQMLRQQGAAPGEADEIVALLAERLSPDEMHVWLSHPQKSHGIPDPEAAREMEAKGLIPVIPNWTPVNAIAGGKTHLVIAEAKRFAAE